MKFLEEIFIGSKFDAKGFKQAETALGKLNGTAKKVAGSLGLAFGAAAITQYGKAAVKAFAEDEAAALRLNRAVENLGIGFANPAIADYIAKLERSAVIADDILRPAFQGLLTTTGSLTQSQKLLNDAITISRASGIELATVTDDLGKGYIGITKGLTKYNTGLTRAELQSKSFNEILGTLLKRSAGAAEDYLDTTAYKMDVLGLATNNASEIIGKGFVDALARAAGGTEASDAQIFLENMAFLFNKITLAAGTTVGAVPTLLQNLKKLGKDIFYGFAGKQVGISLAVPEKEALDELSLSQKKYQELLAKFEKDALKRERERLALKNKQLTADKAKLVLAKGEAALLKGNEVFDLDKIQIAAALTNQAEQLGKATTSSQVLQIANDTARLNVKKSILELEAAIASKDEAAIIAATAKLNADLKVLNTLGLQNVKMQDIKSILESLKPKDLINLANLNAAIALLQQLLGMQASSASTTTAIATATQAKLASFKGSTASAFASLTTAEKATLGGYAPFVGSITSNVPAETFGASGVGLGNNGTGSQVPAGVSITNNFNGIVGDPNGVAELMDQLLQDAVDRGTLRVR